jgi:hypothetical protein
MIRFFINEAQPEKILNLELINLFWPIPSEGLKGFDDGKTGGLDPMKNGAVVTRSGFTLNSSPLVVVVVCQFACRPTDWER